MENQDFKKELNELTINYLKTINKKLENENILLKEKIRRLEDKEVQLTMFNYMVASND